MQIVNVTLNIGTDLWMITCAVEKIKKILLNTF